MEFVGKFERKNILHILYKRRMIDSNSSSLFLRAVLYVNFPVYISDFNYRALYICREIEAYGIFNLILLEEIEIPFLVFLHNVY